MEPITIDLNNLTQEDIEFSLSKREKGCMYSSPCIIGTLIPESRREWLDNCSDITTVRNLIKLGYIEVPEDQKEDVIRLQSLYDTLSDDALRDLASKYIDKG